MNDFRLSLAASHAWADAPWWLECYKKAFPTLSVWADHRQDGDHQRAGIDRSLVLSNGKTVWIDEKVRGRNKITGKVYEDIALEEWSDYERRVPGWVCKPLLCDYIAYAIAPLGVCYLLPVIQLQAAWNAHKDEWTRGFRIAAENNGWTTICWPVAPRVLFPAIGSMLRVAFEPTEWEE